MDDRGNHVIAFYSRHPISAEHILLRLQEERGGLADVRPEELYPFDQDHYGGLKANAMLATRAKMRPDLKVADFCAGLGGPARWWASQHGVQVTGLELNPDRARGAQGLNRLVGLDGQVDVIEGDVLAPPFADATFDIVVSQEAFLHVPDTREALRQAFRILRPGGRIAFTDWVMHQNLTDDEAQDMWRGIAAQSLHGIPEYESLVAEVGFQKIATDDLTGDWSHILADRRKMYLDLRQQAKAAGAPSGDDDFFDSYSRLVRHVQAGKLGGTRVTASKPETK